MANKKQEWDYARHRARINIKRMGTVFYRNCRYYIANVDSGNLILRWQVRVHPGDPDLREDDGTYPDKKYQSGVNVVLIYGLDGKTICDTAVCDSDALTRRWEDYATKLGRKYQLIGVSRTDREPPQTEYPYGLTPEEIERYTTQERPN